LISVKENMKVLLCLIFFICQFYLAHSQINTKESFKSEYINYLAIKLFNTNGNGAGFGGLYERRITKTSKFSLVLPIDFWLKTSGEGSLGKIRGANINPGIRYNLETYVNNYLYCGTSILLGSRNGSFERYDFNQNKNININSSRFQMIPYLNGGAKGYFSRRVSFNIEVGLGYRLIDRTSFDLKPNIVVYDLEYPNDTKIAGSLFFGIGYNF